MTEGGRRDDGRVSTMARLSQAVAIATGMALLATMACDTVARIPTEDRTFRNLHPVTISPHDAGEEGCGAIDGSQGGVMSMVFLDNDGEPIKPGEDIERTQVALGGDDISFEGGNLYSIPDVDCGGSDDPDEICTGQLRCQSAESGGDRCQESSAIITQSDPVFAGVEPSSHAFAVAMANVGRWRGRYDEDFDDLYEFVEDGQNTPLEDPGETGVAVDEGGLRTNSLVDLGIAWGQLTEYVNLDERETYFGFWHFGETASSVESQIQGPSSWTQDPETAREVVDELEDSPRGQGRAGVYNALDHILKSNDGFGAEGTVASAEEKQLLFLVAGYDERPQQELDDLIDTARDAGVKVSVVQVDPELSEPELLRDDEEYYRGKYDEPCGNANSDSADDSMCEYHETCREPKRYTDDSDTDDESQIVWPNPNSHDEGDKYCLPDYDSNGRIGPIEQYQRLACATGGSYHYVPDLHRSSMAQPMIAQLWAPEAAWEIDILIDEHPGRTEGGEAYLLEMTMDAFIGRNQRFRFDIGSSSEPDTREVFFTPESQ